MYGIAIALTLMSLHPKQRFDMSNNFVKHDYRDKSIGTEVTRKMSTIAVGLHCNIKINTYIYKYVN